MQLRDLAIGGRPSRLVSSKRIWRCRETLCPKATWTERRDDVVRPRNGMTERARAEVCRQVGKLGRPVAQLAGELGVGWQVPPSKSFLPSHTERMEQRCPILTPGVGHVP
nr:hypothetical protein [Euzebya pacifica]